MLLLIGNSSGNGLFEIVEMKMGWIAIAAPGTKYGPCKDDCNHIDCAASRKEAATPCRHCGEPIGYDTRYYNEGEGADRKLEHFSCAWEEEDRRRKANVG